MSPKGNGATREHHRKSSKPNADKKCSVFPYRWSLDLIYAHTFYEYKKEDKLQKEVS